MWMCWGFQLVIIVIRVAEGSVSLTNSVFLTHFIDHVGPLFGISSKTSQPTCYAKVTWPDPVLIRSWTSKYFPFYSSCEGTQSSTRKHRKLPMRSFYFFMQSSKQYDRVSDMAGSVCASLEHFVFFLPVALNS